MREANFGYFGQFLSPHLFENAMLHTYLVITDALLAYNWKFPPCTGNSQTWLFASLMQGHSFALLSCALLCTLLRAFFFPVFDALFCVFLYLAAFTATMFGSCVSQLSFFAYGCFREFCLQLEHFCFQRESVCQAPQQTISQKAFGHEKCHAERVLRNP